MPISKTEVSLCWNCVHASNSAPHICPWASQGKRVEGWKLKRGPIQKGQQLVLVISCPLHAQKYTFFEPSEIKQAIANHLHKTVSSFSQNPYRMLKYALQYERETGEKLPEWFYFYIEQKREHQELLAKGIAPNKLESELENEE